MFGFKKKQGESKEDTKIISTTLYECTLTNSKEKMLEQIEKAFMQDLSIVMDGIQSEVELKLLDGKTDRIDYRRPTK